MLNEGTEIGGMENRKQKGRRLKNNRCRWTVKKRHGVAKQKEERRERDRRRGRSSAVAAAGGGRQFGLQARQGDSSVSLSCLPHTVFLATLYFILWRALKRQKRVILPHHFSP